MVVTGFEGTRKQIDKLCADVEVQSGEKAYWFRYDENGEIVGGIAKFVQPMKDAVVAALGLEKGCFVGLTAGKLLAAQKAAGVLRSKLGAFCPNHMDKECYEFCWIVDFPMYEIGEESGLLEFCHNPFSMPNGGLEILKKAAAGEVDPLSITAFQYDLVCNGVELSSGAVRNHDRREGQVPRHVQRLHLRRAPPRGHRPRRGPHGHAAGRRGLHPGDHPLPHEQERPGSHDGRPFLRHPSPAGRAEHRLHQEGGGRGRRVTAFASFPQDPFRMWKTGSNKNQEHTAVVCSWFCIS